MPFYGCVVFRVNAAPLVHSPLKYTWVVSFGAIRDKAAINICMQCLWEHVFSFLLGKLLGVGLLGYMISGCFAL